MSIRHNRNYRAVAGAVAFGVYDEQGTRVAAISTAIGNQQGVAELLAAAPALARALIRVARLNPDAGEIGAGMLATIVGEARAALTQAGVDREVYFAQRVIT